jgi:putative Holliday junction resolvase
VDYGRARIGLAVSDPLGITVRGLDTLTRPAGGIHGPESLDAAARAVLERLGAEGVEEVVVGIPYLASGDASEASREALAFARRLEALGGLPVHLVDEHLSTWEAEEALRERGVSVREARRTGAVDREVAVRLLRSFLDGRATGEGGEGGGAGEEARGG